MSAEKPIVWKNWWVVREAKGRRFRNIWEQFPIQRRILRMTNGRKWKIEAALRGRGFPIFKSDYRFTEGIGRGWTEPLGWKGWVERRAAAGAPLWLSQQLSRAE